MSITLRNSPWRDELVERLRRLVANGLTASQIAAKMPPGFSRSAVIGKVSRIGLRLANLPTTKLTPEQKAKKREKRRAKYAMRAPCLTAPKKELPSFFVGEPGSLGIPLADLRRSQCKWPTHRDAEDDQWRFCGAAAELDRPYCLHHCQRAVGLICAEGAAPVEKQKRKDRKVSKWGTPLRGGNNLRMLDAAE